MAGRAGYVLAAICLLAGLAVAGWLGWSAFAALQNALTRVVVPGTSTLTLDQPGNYTIFHEAESVVDGKLYSVQTISGLRVTMTSEDGTPIDVVVPGMSSSYAIGGHSGQSVLSFDIAAPGRYRLTAAYADGRTEPKTVLAVAHAFFGRLILAIFGAIGSVFAGFAAALAFGLTTYFRRRRMQ
jgi:hypothetical protein